MPAIRRCCINACDSNSREQPHLRFFQFPKPGHPFHSLWLQACATSLNRILPLKKPVVCALHFDPKNLGGRRLTGNPIPCLKMDGLTNSLSMEREQMTAKDYELTRKNLFLNAVVYEWVVRCNLDPLMRGKVTHGMIKTRAEEAKIIIGVDGFVADKNWLNSFRETQLKDFAVKLADNQLKPQGGNSLETIDIIKDLENLYSFKANTESFANTVVKENAVVPMECEEIPNFDAQINQQHTSYMSGNFPRTQMCIDDATTTNEFYALYNKKAAYTNYNSNNYMNHQKQQQQQKNNVTQRMQKLQHPANAYSNSLFQKYTVTGSAQSDSNYSSPQYSNTSQSPPTQNTTEIQQEPAAKRMKLWATRRTSTTTTATVTSKSQQSFHVDSDDDVQFVNETILPQKSNTLQEDKLKVKQRATPKIFHLAAATAKDAVTGNKQKREEVLRVRNALQENTNLTKQTQASPINILTYEAALEYIKPLEKFAAFQCNFRVMGLLFQLENVFLTAVGKYAYKDRLKNDK